MHPDFKLTNLLAAALLLLAATTLPAQHSIYEPLQLDEVTYSLEDFGNMWTFDAVPVDLFEKRYDFRPGEEWLEDVRLSALEFSTGCSASFVSEDGLIMTNHHCIRGALPRIQQEGENLQQDGFYAKEQSSERPFPGMYVDQLMEIKDVTAAVHGAMAAGQTDDERVKLRDQKIEELTKGCQDGFTCRVITLYDGGKYVLHTYKRYNDVRLVMAPDVQITATGWDWDNFTYPRYELDFAFLRAYDETGQPVKSPHFFQWSQKGAEDGEAVFVIGRPGNTDRLLSYSQLEYHRDVRNPGILNLFNELYQAYYQYFRAHPEREAELLSQLLSVANTRKVFAGFHLALNDPYLMAKKKDFEEKLQQRVASDEALKKEYGGLWEKADKAVDSLKLYGNEFRANFILGFGRPAHLKLAQDLVDYAEQMQLPEAQREEAFQDDKLEQTKAALLSEIPNRELESLLIAAHANFLGKVAGKDSELLQLAYGGHMGEAAAQFILEKSIVAHPDKVKALLDSGPEGILSSDGPYIRFVLHSRHRLEVLNPILQSAQNTLEVQNQRLGRLIFEVFKGATPPDATASLRISDGQVLGYEYNGTLAPAKTTYFGLWDRYYSFGQTSYPWGLHERWKKPPAGLDLSVPICFVSTNDIVGGNSGSAVINQKGEVVGLAHDGNMESIAGGYAFLPEANRTIATDSWGLMEALKLVYKTDRLVKELEGGKME
ncbi:MAG: S46 family peptidase [Phaeodactylibacter sp.]|nr:S46 family peptidase [Phaeodactylibacter sp.]MCB9301217.1 S46 family peptidase [Lewinellaceae bacterium]